MIGPAGLAATSPLLAWRDPIYVLAGFAGIIAMALMLAQPLLAGGYLPGLNLLQSRRTHRMLGVALVLLVALHVVGLWITSPPDVIDALTFTSPTPFSVWGVIGMWAIFVSALTVVLRRRLRLAPPTWPRVHKAFAVLIVTSTALHALQIIGAMEPISKALLSGLIFAVTIGVILRRPRPQRSR
ncbi:ferric reductase-like transmembrane domain-containing protein [Octadecabacter sp. R77987]|uniref:ferric reductase-like transmembrane domain-containing protein n=1 Tax=Octadecabacter sp. R77987 TaxID=3093874 RepID=UPI00366A625F